MAVPRCTSSTGPRQPVPLVGITEERLFEYALTKNRISNIWQQPFIGGPPKQITNLESGTDFRLSLVAQTGGTRVDPREPDQRRHHDGKLPLIACIAMRISQDILHDKTLTAMTRRRWIADEVSGIAAALIGSHADHLANALRGRIGQEFDIATAEDVRHGRIVSIADGRVDSN